MAKQELTRSYAFTPQECHRGLQAILPWLGVVVQAGERDGYTLKAGWLGQGTLSNVINRVNVVIPLTCHCEPADEEATTVRLVTEFKLLGKRELTSDIRDMQQAVGDLLARHLANPSAHPELNALRAVCLYAIRQRKAQRPASQIVRELTANGLTAEEAEVIMARLKVIRSARTSIENQRSIRVAIGLIGLLVTLFSVIATLGGYVLIAYGAILVGFAGAAGDTRKLTALPAGKQIADYAMGTYATQILAASPDNHWRTVAGRLEQNQRTRKETNEEREEVAQTKRAPESPFLTDALLDRMDDDLQESLE